MTDVRGFLAPKRVSDKDITVIITNGGIDQELEYRGHVIKINQDTDAQNPREWDNLGKMVCFHRRYNLGDKHEFDTPEDFQEWAEKNAKKIIVLPLYLYDHSGITIKTGPFSCPWDSGQVGWIYITYEKIRKEFSCKRVTKSMRDKIRGYLVNEVKTYDDYLTGNVYGYSVEPKENNRGINCTDSCWGYFGDDGVEYAISEAKSNIDYQITEYKKWVIKHKEQDMEIKKLENECFAL